MWCEEAAEVLQAKSPPEQYCVGYRILALGFGLQEQAFHTASCDLAMKQHKSVLELRVKFHNQALECTPNRPKDC